jgi:hypothetical protein
MIAWALQRKVFANCNHGWSMLGQSMPGARTATVRKGLSCVGRCFRAKWHGPSPCPLHRPPKCSGGGGHMNLKLHGLPWCAKAMTKPMSIACQKQCSFSFGFRFPFKKVSAKSAMSMHFPMTSLDIRTGLPCTLAALLLVLHRHWHFRAFAKHAWGWGFLAREQTKKETKHNAKKTRNDNNNTARNIQVLPWK